MMASSDGNSTREHILNEVKRIVLAQLVGTPAKVYLIESWARREERRTSDIDAAIHRFEFIFETTWKAAKQMVFDVDGIDVSSPNGVIRPCREVGLFDDEETIQALQMVDDRNLTVCTYDEALAMEIHERLKHHRGLLWLWLERIEERSRLNG